MFAGAIVVNLEFAPDETLVVAFVVLGYVRVVADAVVRRALRSI